MKSISTQLSYFYESPEARRNVRMLLKYVAFVFAVIVVFTIGFHFIKLYVEGESHSWITGLYWTLTVMSTLGFGDITFQSDIGRLFSVIVLVSGIVLLLIVLPFAFIRFFYAPWLESQIRHRAPRALPSATSDHVVICTRDAIAIELTERLERGSIPYVFLEPDPAVASNWHVDEVPVVIGEVDSKETYLNARADQARLILANSTDVVNTNIVLTVREAAPDVPVAAVATNEDSIDILELSGATHVLPVKKWLGEQLANRVHAQHAELLPIGEYENLRLAELPVHNTPLAGRTVRETRLRETIGVSIIAVWERGTLHAAHPDMTLTSSSVPVVIGTEDQLRELNELVAIYDANPNPVLVIGGGTVGAAAVDTLSSRNIPVHLVERERSRCRQLRDVCQDVFCGDAADYDLLQEAGIKEAPSVLLTTNDDAVNIYLASYCRRLNPDLRIVSRITHERNLEAIHRAGADFVLSYASLGAEAVNSILKGKKLIVMGEGADLFMRSAPPSLHNRTLAESEIGARTGLSVVALAEDGEIRTGLSADTEIPPGAELLMIGNGEQIQDFIRHFE